MQIKWKTIPKTIFFNLVHMITSACLVISLSNYPMIYNLFVFLLVYCILAYIYLTMERKIQNIKDKIEELKEVEEVQKAIGNYSIIYKHDGYEQQLINLVTRNN